MSVGPRLWIAGGLAGLLSGLGLAQELKPPPDPRIAPFACQLQAEKLDVALKELQLQLLSAGLLNAQGQLDVAAHDTQIAAAAAGK